MTICIEDYKKHKSISANGVYDYNFGVCLVYMHK